MEKILKLKSVDSDYNFVVIGIHGLGVHFDKFKNANLFLSILDYPEQYFLGNVILEKVSFAYF